MKSWLTNFLSILLVFVVVFTISGCDLFGDDDDDNDESGNQTLADEYFNHGTNLLQEALYLNINSGSDRVILATLELDAVLLAFNRAIEHDSNHSGAHFCLGVIDAALVTNEERFKTLFSDLHSFEFLYRIFEFRYPIFDDTINGGSEKAIITPFNLMHSITNLDENEQIINYETQQEIREYILPEIAKAIQHFELVWADEDFTFGITPRMQGDENFDIIEIDRTDIAAVLFALHSVNATLNHLISYDMQIGDINGVDLQNVLVQDSPFLTLYETGANDMGVALASWNEAVNYLENGLLLLENETDNQQNDLIKIDPYDLELIEDIEQLSQEIPRIKNLLTSQADFDFDLDGDGYEEETITVSLNNFYSNPVENWKEMLPSYTINIDPESEFYYVTGYLVWDANSVDEWLFPDPTFNGLFPGMTNSRLVELLLNGNEWDKYNDFEW